MERLSSVLKPPHIRRRRGFSGRRYDGAALRLLPVHNPLRRVCIDLIENKWFDRLVLILIAANSLSMALRDPMSPKRDETSGAEWFFIVSFTVELVIKVIAMGLTPLETRHCYLSEGWNVFDSLVVLSSWAAQLSTGGGAFATLRTFRVLKPLRSISRIAGMRLLVRSMLRSIPELGDVLLLFSFLLLAFAIVGVELFGGRLHYD